MYIGCYYFQIGLYDLEVSGRAISIYSKFHTTNTTRWNLELYYKQARKNV